MKSSYFTRIIFIISLFIFSASIFAHSKNNAQSQETRPPAKKQATTDVIKKNGVIHYNNGYTYKGNLKNGKPHGKGGIYDSKSEQVYEGEFKNGRIHGKGKQWFTNNKNEYDGRYEGYFINGLPDGKGKLYDTEGRVTYSGTFKKGKRHGKFTFRIYDDHKNKRGSYLFDGIWTGKMVNGNFEQGEFTYLDGGKYTGDLKQGHPHGMGTRHFGLNPINLYIKGTRLPGGRIVKVKQGFYYRGNFAFGFPHGKGKMTLANGNVIESTFEYGMLSGPTTITSHTGNIIFSKNYAKGVRTGIYSWVSNSNYDVIRETRENNI